MLIQLRKNSNWEFNCSALLIHSRDQTTRWLLNIGAFCSCTTGDQSSGSQSRLLHLSALFPKLPNQAFKNCEHLQAGLEWNYEALGGPWSLGWETLDWGPQSESRWRCSSFTIILVNETEHETRKQVQDCFSNHFTSLTNTSHFWGQDESTN